VFNCGSHVAEENLHLPRQQRYWISVWDAFTEIRKFHLQKNVLLITVNTLIYITSFEENNNHILVSVHWQEWDI